MELETQLKVIGIGFPRTGTNTLRVALNMLGFGPCYHFWEYAAHPDHANMVKFWANVESLVASNEPNRIQWEAFFTKYDYESGCDQPLSVYWRELMAAYPNGKFILTVRDPYKWYQSYAKTCVKSWNLERWILSYICPHFITHTKCLNRFLKDNNIDVDNFKEKEAVKSFNAFIERVKDEIKDESRLLIYDVSDGWQPLCQFLDVEIPKDKEFPVTNNQANYAKLGRKFRNRMWRRIIIKKVIPLVLLCFIVIYFKRK